MRNAKPLDPLAHLRGKPRAVIGAAQDRFVGRDQLVTLMVQRQVLMRTESLSN
jgi:hypothetical protein